VRPARLAADRLRRNGKGCRGDWPRQHTGTVLQCWGDRQGAGEPFFSAGATGSFLRGNRAASIITSTSQARSSGGSRNHISESAWHKGEASIVTSTSQTA